MNNILSLYINSDQCELSNYKIEFRTHVRRSIMHSRKSLNFIAQFMLLIFSWLVWTSNSLRGVNGSELVQLNDCSCLSYTQTFECTICGVGRTVWNGTFFDCNNGIELRHSRYNMDGVDPDGRTSLLKECNKGAVLAKGIGRFGDCYTSQLIVTVGEEMINGTIECIHDNFIERTVVDQKSLMIIEPPLPPPGNVHIESNDSHQITFAWDEVAVQCSSLQYIITAINCGVCPNITVDKNVTCDIQSHINPHTAEFNNTCLFAVQTEICGYLWGNKSEYVMVHMEERREGDTTVTSVKPEAAGPGLVNDVSIAIVIPVVASVLLVGIFLLLLIVIAMILFMSKQITNAKLRVKNTMNAAPQVDRLVTASTAAQNNQEGIYSLLQPLEDNNTNGTDQIEVVVYADIGPSPGAGKGLRCETMLHFQDNKVEYAEIHEPAQSAPNPSQLPDSSLPLDLNNLLDQIGEKVASEWYQLGRAVGISEELLDECSNRSPQEAVVEVLDYWIRNHNPSWEDVPEMLNEVGLRELANSLRQGKLQRKIEEDDDKIEDLHTVAVTTCTSVYDNCTL